MRILVVPVLATALLWLPGGGASSVTPCATSNYGLDVLLRRAHQGVMVTVGIASADVPTCNLRTTVRVTIGRKGTPGGGRSWRVARPLSPWAPFAHSWVWRNWCGPRSRLIVSAVSPGNRSFASVAAAPRCRDRRLSLRLDDAGAGRLPRSGDGIPAGILPPETPIPISPSILRTTNGWLVSNGLTLIAVYAGEAGDDPSVGSFGIIRQNLVFAYQARDILTVQGTGALQITVAPAGAAVETSAQHGEISFASTRGQHGVLDLATDTVELGY